MNDNSFLNKFTTIISDNSIIGNYLTKNKEKYKNFGIPYKRNYLFSGLPGTGKTSFITSIASELGYLNENEPTVFDDESMDELLDIISKYVEDPDDAQAELDRFDQGGFDALSNMVAANLDRDPEYKAWYNKLHSIKESVDISYTDPGFRFYKMKVDGKRLNREEGTEYLKGLGIDMEIPRSYDESILDKIVAQLKEKGIDADHNAAMDVS